MIADDVDHDFGFNSTTSIIIYDAIVVSPYRLLTFGRGSIPPTFSLLNVDNSSLECNRICQFQRSRFTSLVPGRAGYSFKKKS
jgi:hypothetical protein